VSADRAVAIIAVLVLAPFALVLLAAIVRGYTIDLHMTRDIRRGHWRRPRDEDNGDGS
jgi:hypothetical protein